MKERSMPTSSILVGLGLQVLALGTIAFALSAGHEASAEITIDEWAAQDKPSSRPRYRPSTGYDVKIPPPIRPGSRVPAPTPKAAPVRPAQPTTVAKPAPPAASKPPNAVASAPAPSAVAPSASPAPKAAAGSAPENTDAIATASPKNEENVASLPGTTGFGGTSGFESDASVADDSVAPEVEAQLQEGGPYTTIQVGAYRNEKSAQRFMGEIKGRFEGIYLQEITSGGRPLYRVRIGRFYDKAAAAEMRQRIVAAGYPAFEAMDQGNPGTVTTAAE